MPADGVKGTLIWFKPALVSGEPADVRQYALQNAAFPQQSTIHQWFDESQFESYRKLGELYAREAFETAKKKAKLGDPGSFTPEQVRDLFAALRDVDVHPTGFVMRMVDAVAEFVGRLSAAASAKPSVNA